MWVATSDEHATSIEVACSSFVAIPTLYNI